MSDTIATTKRTIRLAKMEIAYLANTQFLPADLARIVHLAETVDSQARLLTIDGDIAERFRDEFTARLAKVGFGLNYEPTREGKMLENLIDRFAAKK